MKSQWDKVHSNILPGPASPLRLAQDGFKSSTCPFINDLMLVKGLELNLLESARESPVDFMNHFVYLWLHTSGMSV